jgi:hypothetical protein
MIINPLKMAKTFKGATGQTAVLKNAIAVVICEIENVNENELIS